MDKINFDLIISNPPYGALGADITKKIIDEVEFKEFVNLLPANDYKRNSTKDLFKYARDMISINEGFDDASVTTHLCKMVKEANAVTLDEFERSQYTDPSLDKYFKENYKRTSIFDTHPRRIKNEAVSVAIGHRDASNKHLAYSKKTPTYLFNMGLMPRVTFEKLSTELHHKLPTGNLTCEIFEFKLPIERKNFVDFIYSEDGFRFISKIFISLNKDSTDGYAIAFPKVDWTQGWTVENILVDYDYTKEEIKEVINDLVNFKGMDK